MDSDKRLEHLLQAAILMGQALALLDEAGEGRAGALLDHAITALPGRARAVHEERANWPAKDSDA